MKLYFLTSLAFILLLSSCVSTNYITLDTRQPALLTFPPDDANIFIVDNVPEHYERISKRTRKDTISTDYAKKVMVGSLLQYMNGEKYFSSVNLYPYNTGIEGYYDNDMPLDEELIKDICQREAADALISIDMFAISAEHGLQEVIGGLTYETLEVKLGTILRVYSEEGIRIAPPIVYIDSLLWYSSPNLEDTYQNLLNINDAVNEITTNAADKLVDAFIPSWKTEERWYYSDSSSDMKKAMQFVKQGNWQEAAIIWEELYNKEKKDVKKIRLASNLALANESLDNIDNAVKWIDSAFNLLNEDKESDLTLNIITYRAILADRQRKQQKLYEQLGINQTIEP